MTEPEPSIKDTFRVERWSDAPEGEESACADCGTYCDLIGPVTFDGEIVEGGDMVCPSCAESRGVDLTHCTCGTSSPATIACPGCGDFLGYESQGDETTSEATDEVELASSENYVETVVPRLFQRYSGVNPTVITVKEATAQYTEEDAICWRISLSFTTQISVGIIEGALAAGFDEVDSAGEMTLHPDGSVTLFATMHQPDDETETADIETNE